MFAFHCHRCEESFKVYLENLASKKSLRCPNCDLAVPEEAMSQLNILGDSYRKAVDDLKRTNDVSCGWSITVVGYDALRPEKIDELDISFDDTRQRSYWDYDVTQESLRRRFSGLK